MPIPKDPTAVIYFTGLLVFCFDKQLKHCQVGIYSKSDDHALKLRFVKKKAGVVSSEQALTLNHSLIRSGTDLWLGIDGPPPKQPDVKPFIVGKPTQPPSDPQDFRHVVDLEGEHFYNRRLNIRKGVLKPSLFITNGLFYTATLSPQSYRIVQSPSNGMNHLHTHRGPATSIATDHNLGEIAEYVGVNLYLDRPDQAVVLKAGKRSGQELLRLQREKGARYEITIENGPTDRAPVGSHFGHYYDALQLREGEAKILLEVERPSPKESGRLRPLGIDGRVCEAIQLSKSARL